ncbi:MAG TPA: regulatory iron-sulfur-containing complex subunit RicT [Bacilli bacterium]|nr:regulatory iron-sulfur-containing complex subunit RicT [Bacilli bacterium]
MENETYSLNNPESGKNQYFLSIVFNNGPKTYFFSCPHPNIEVNDFVIVETIQGIEIAKAASEVKPLSEFSSPLELKPILRKADEDDVRRHLQNLEDAKRAKDFCVDQIKSLGLDMVLLSAEYNLDRSKILFIYYSENRVDFRDLLKILASEFHTRVELRQIGSRDKAKIVGGIGICGFPLCCSTFLNEFDGISISRAKNQMLALNIPKLSGHCGKLICCLKYEDDYYSEAKKDFPRINARFTNDNQKTYYKVKSFNVINRTIQLVGENEYLTVPLDEFNQKWTRFNEAK